MYLSSADGGRAITDAVIETERILQAASALRGVEYALPKGGAKFHFTYPGSVQGFELDLESAAASITNETANSLDITPAGSGTVRVLTPTFIPQEALEMPGYQFFASPTLYSGQAISASVKSTGTGEASVRLAIRVYDETDASTLITSDAMEIAAGQTTSLLWTVPDTDGMPIHAVGIEIEGGTPVALESLTWSGAPNTTLARPGNRDATLWRRAWVDAVDHFEARFFEAFRISNNDGRGLMSIGTRDWVDYTVQSTITPYLAKNFGVAAHIQGLRRYYALVLGNDQKLKLIKRDDTEETVLAESRWSGMFSCQSPLP